MIAIKVCFESLGEIEQERRYEAHIESLIKKDFSYINTEKLDKVIIPINFIKSVKEFMCSLGLSESVTYNEFFRAYGKTIYDKNSDMYLIFLDIEKALYLMDDSLKDIFYNLIDESGITLAKKEEEKSKNLLAHEISHVEFNTYVKKEKFEEDVAGLYYDIAFSLFDEYYACRRASLGTSISIIEYDENIVKKIEKYLIIKKCEYKYGKIPLNEFIKSFNEMFRSCAIWGVSYVGFLNGKEKDDLFPDCRIGKVIDEIKTYFDNMYDNLVYNKEFNIPEDVFDCIEKYFSLFGLYYSDTEQGIYLEVK